MRVDHELRQLLIAELCAIVANTDQYMAAAMLDLRQPQISALRQGRGAGFSVGRLLRIVSERGYNVDVSFTVIPRRFERPRKLPTITVTRHDHFGRPVPRP